MSLSCERCVLSGRDICDGPITRPEESYLTWCVSECDLDTSTVRRPWPARGCRAMKKKYALTKYYWSWRMKYFGMWCCVFGLVVRGVWKDLIAFKWASVTMRPKWRHIPEDLNHLQNRRENQKTRVTDVLTRYLAQHIRVRVGGLDFYWKNGSTVCAILLNETKFSKMMAKKCGKWSPAFCKLTV
jgi:hypothetical protein